MLNKLSCAKLLTAAVFGVIAAATAHAFTVAQPQETGAAQTLNLPVIRVAANDKCVYKCRILREECTQDASAQSRPDDQCWDNYGSCRTACESGVTPTTPTNTPTPPVTPNRNPDTIVLNPTVIEVGKWAEGIAFDGTWLWAAESGQRTISMIDFYAGRVQKRFKVGRLPVAMASSKDGIVYSLVHTDQLIWRQSAQRGGGVFTRLRECPEAMISDGGTQLFVLTLPNCSSESSRVTRIDTRNGRQTPSRVLGEWGQALTAHESNIWVAHARAPALTIVDENSMDSWQMDVHDASFWAITSNSGSIYAGGRVNENNQDGLVVMIDPYSQQEQYRAYVSERVAEITSDQEHVIAVGENGTVWIFSAQNLELLRTITFSTGGFQPRDVLLHDDAIVMTSSTHRGEFGAVLVAYDWRPSSQPSAPTHGNVSPSFDCNAARTDTEHAICGSNQLSALDAKMASEYDLALSNITSPAVGGTAADVADFRNEQARWLRVRNRCRSDVGCLTAAYQDRLRILGEYNQPE